MLNTFARSNILRLAAAVVLVLLVIVIGLFAIPQGREWAQPVFSLFKPAPTQVSGGANTAPAGAQPTITMAPAVYRLEFEDKCGGVDRPTCSLEQIRKLAKFEVKAFRAVPDGYSFVGATGGRDIVRIMYETQAGGQLYINEEVFTGSSTQMMEMAAENAEIKPLAIGNVITGQYAKGGYPLLIGNDRLEWVADADAQVLRWMDMGVLYNVVKIGAEPRLDMAGMLALMETLTP